MRLRCLTVNQSEAKALSVDALCSRTCEPPANSHRSSIKVTLFPWRVYQILIKRLATTLPYLLQREPNMTWHFSKFVPRRTEAPHETFTFYIFSRVRDNPLLAIKLSNLKFILWKGFLPGCYFLASLSYMFRAHSDYLWLLPYLSVCWQHFCWNVFLYCDSFEQTLRGSNFNC